MSDIITTSSPVTLVTCYYEIKSKHSNLQYRKWIQMFLQNLQANIVIFTNNKLVRYLRRCTQHIQSKVHFIICPFKKLDLYAKYLNIWKKQYEMDPNKECGRTIGCYILWNSKFKFLKRAIDLNPFQTEKFIWNDIGNVRNLSQIEFLQNYPNLNKISNDQIDIIYLDEYQNLTQTFFQNEVHVSGSIFGGPKNLILELHTKYYQLLQKYVDNGKFIGCDQQILSSLILENKTKFNLIKPTNTIVNRWFWLYYYWGTDESDETDESDGR